MQDRRFRSMLVLLAGAALLSACDRGRAEDAEMGMAQQAGSMADAVEYTLVFRNTWTPASHPVEYPEAGAISGPHYSGIIGASHDASFTLFRDGTMPTMGIERLSEEGKHSPLDDEIRAAIAAGSAGALFATGPLRDLGDSLVATVRVNAAHPLVSFVAMIAPSPDWFAGAAGVNLMEDGGWAASRTLHLMAYDAGSDDGATYKAADRDNAPKKPTMMATTRHFAPGGTPVPVATVTLTRNR